VQRMDGRLVEVADHRRGLLELERVSGTRPSGLKELELGFKKLEAG